MKIIERHLTKNIKYRLRSFRPEMPSQMRTIRYAEEVNVGSGYVDFVRFEDYIEKTTKEKTCKLKLYRTLKHVIEQNCKTFNHDCINCPNYGYAEIKTIGILMTCYEIKISKSDFKSKNGHNFVGHNNYYVVPKELVEKIKDLVPDDIGIIVYYPKSSDMRIYKKCVTKEIDNTDLAIYLYNALKKWVDASHRL